MNTMNQSKYWLTYAVDEEPVRCCNFESAIDLAVKTRELIEDNVDRDLYLFSFYGERLMITKGPERYLVIPHHSPTHYPLFGRSGEITDVDDSDGRIVTASSADPAYRQATTRTDVINAEFEEVEPADDLLTEPTEPLKEH